ncbi:hypothetical protein ACV1DV_16465 [Aeromonas veronii]
MKKTLDSFFASLKTGPIKIAFVDVSLDGDRFVMDAGTYGFHSIDAADPFRCLVHLVGFLDNVGKQAADNAKNRTDWLMPRLDWRHAVGCMNIAQNVSYTLAAHAQGAYSRPDFVATMRQLVNSAPIGNWRQQLDKTKGWTARRLAAYQADLISLALSKILPEGDRV